MQLNKPIVIIGIVMIIVGLITSIMSLFLPPIWEQIGSMQVSHLNPLSQILAPIGFFIVAIGACLIKSGISAD
jgi:uncharacterized membrane protein YozB (DUF420 family)